VQRRDSDPDGARSTFESALQAGRRKGIRSVTAQAILGLACLAADAGDRRQAAVLHGAAQACLHSTGRSWEALEAGCREDSLADVRASLGTEEFERAYAEGVALSFDAAIDLASGKDQPDTLAARDAR
jgi:hypothetical protein